MIQEFRKCNTLNTVKKIGKGRVEGVVMGTYISREKENSKEKSVRDQFAPVPQYFYPID